MLQRVMTFLMVFGLSVGLLPRSAYSGDGDAIRRGLQERLRPSRMEVGNPALEGYVFKPGAVVVLQAESAPAKKLRVIQANTKSPRFHVPDYAEVTVGRDGSLTAGSGDFTLSKGTRLVVLDLKAEPDRIRLFTHTADPIVVGGKPVYGCTEFVFRFHGTPLTARDVAQVEGVIERWLPFAR